MVERLHCRGANAGRSFAGAPPIARRMRPPSARARAFLGPPVSPRGVGRRLLMRVHKDAGAPLAHFRMKFPVGWICASTGGIHSQHAPPRLGREPDAAAHHPTNPQQARQALRHGIRVEAVGTEAVVWG